MQEVCEKAANRNLNLFKDQQTIFDINATQQSVHWTLGILPHFQAFFWLRVFSAPGPLPSASNANRWALLATLASAHHVDEAAALPPDTLRRLTPTLGIRWRARGLSAAPLCGSLDLTR
jgi:hypothetical protein